MQTSARTILRSFLTKQRSKLTKPYLTSILAAFALSRLYASQFLPPPGDYRLLNDLLVSVAFWFCAKAVSAVGQSICLSAISAPISGFGSPLETAHTLVWLTTIGWSVLHDLAERVFGLVLIGLSMLVCSAFPPLVAEHGVRLLQAPLAASLTFAMCSTAVVLGVGGAGQIRLSRAHG